MALLLRPNVVFSEPLHPASGDVFTLPELQAAVDGYIEAVYFPDGTVMLVNEEGKLKGMPYNDAATELARRAHALLSPDDHIVGPALVLTRHELGEDDLATDLI